MVAFDLAFAIFYFLVLGAKLGRVPTVQNDAI
jgi:hypothetical protein